jgi:hypothetical protein
MRFHRLGTLHGTYFYGKWLFEVLVLSLFLSGCASGPERQIEQFERAENFQRSMDSSAAAAEYGSKK